MNLCMYMCYSLINEYNRFNDKLVFTLLILLAIFQVYPYTANSLRFILACYFAHIECLLNLRKTVLPSSYIVHTIVLFMTFMLFDDNLRQWNNTGGFIYLHPQRLALFTSGLWSIAVFKVTKSEILRNKYIVTITNYILGKFCTV